MSLDKDLRTVNFSDYQTILTFLQKYPSQNCDFNICNLLTWGIYYKLELAICHDRLVLFNPYYSYLLFPIGEFVSAQDLHKMNNCCEKIHKNVEIMVVPEDYVTNTPDLNEYFHIYNDEDWNDYVYSVESLRNLSGKKLAKKKNLISQFKRLYPDYYLKEITGNDYDEILDFSYYWKEAQNRQDDYLDIEFEAIKLMLKNWDLLPSKGLKLYAENKLCAFAIYSPQTEEMVTVHFEKFDPNVKGAAQLINHETALRVEDSILFINREQDMGDPGIRQAKRSYQPLSMMPYYRLKSK